MTKDSETVVAFSIRLPRHMSDTIRELAKRYRRSLNQEITWLLEQALRLEESPPRSDSEED